MAGCRALDPGLKHQARGKTGADINGGVVPADRKVSVLLSPLQEHYIMFRKNFKLSLLATAMMCAAGVSGVSMAHEAIGSLPATGAGASAVDVYHTSCFTWTAAAALLQVPGPESPLPAKRFVARVAKLCPTQSAACGTVSANNIRVSIGGKDGAPTPAVNAGATSITSGTTIAALGNTPTWVKSASTWSQVANNGAATNKNGDYIVAVTHDSAAVSSYWVQLHCENVAVGAIPLPDFTPSIHTGTGVTATGGTMPSPSAATGGDFNEVIDQ